MGNASQDALEHLTALIEQVDESLKDTFQNMHQGNPTHTLVRFLKAREWNAHEAHKMLLDCLKWRIQNQIDDILSKPIIPTDLYRGIRDSQLVGLSGYSKQGLPVFAIGAGLTTFDRASVHYYVQSHIQINEYRDRVILPDASRKYGRHIGTCFKILDMSGLKFSALSHLKVERMFHIFRKPICLPAFIGALYRTFLILLFCINQYDKPTALPFIQLSYCILLLSTIATVDDLNYPEKTETYYIVNVPYIFSACWKVVKPLLRERTRRKIQVLQGCGRDELLEVMDYASLPHFCRREGSGSSRYSSSASDDCYTLDHPFHQQLYTYTMRRAQSKDTEVLHKDGSFHVDVPEPDLEETEIVKTIESELHKIGNRNGITHSLSDLKIERL